MTLAAGQTRSSSSRESKPWVFVHTSHHAGPPRPRRARLRRAHAGQRAREVAHRADDPRRAAATTTAASPRASAAAATSGATASSTSSATRSACPPRSRRSSTIRTAPRASRCCTTPTARSATSSRPDGLKVGDTVLVVAQRRHQAGQHPAAALHPARHDDPQHRAQDSARRADRAARPASGAQLMAKEGDWGQVRLPSGEVRRVHLDCRATIGQVGNIEHGNIHVGKAGRTRWLGRRPHNRGVTMNPVDHPMGGGEGRSSGGRHPCSPWGQLDQGPQDAQQQADRRDDRQAPRQEGIKEPPWLVQSRKVRSSTTTCMKKVAECQRQKSKKVIKTWSRRSTIIPEMRRADVRGAQRPQVRPGVRHREHGRPQARRVRADPHVPRPLRRAQGGRPAAASAAPRRTVRRSRR